MTNFVLTEIDVERREAERTMRNIQTNDKDQEARQCSIKII